MASRFPIGDPKDLSPWIPIALEDMVEISYWECCGQGKKTWEISKDIHVFIQH